MDITDIFDEYDVEYWTSGKNVSRGWINIQCVYCADDSNHLGIRLRDFRVHCWKCGGHNIIQLLMNVAGCTFSKAKEIRLSLGADVPAPPLNDKPSSEYVTRVRLPLGSTNHFPNPHIKYLRKRGFYKPRKTIRKYKLQAMYTTGKWKFRIIIPIYFEGQLVSYTSRDITDRQDPPYLHAPLTKSRMNPKEVIYNYDTLVSGGDAILVEGPIDVWKLGDGAISFLGVENTLQQIVLLKDIKIRNLFILYDNDRPGKRAASRTARDCAPLVKSVEIVNLLEQHDPGELTLEEGESVKRMLSFND